MLTNVIVQVVLEVMVRRNWISTTSWLGTSTKSALSSGTKCASPKSKTLLHFISSGLYASRSFSEFPKLFPNVDSALHMLWLQSYKSPMKAKDLDSTQITFIEEETEWRKKTVKSLQCCLTAQQRKERGLPPSRLQPATRLRLCLREPSSLNCCQRLQRARELRSTCCTGMLQRQATNAIFRLAGKLH